MHLELVKAVDTYATEHQLTPPIRMGLLSMAQVVYQPGHPIYFHVRIPTEGDKRGIMMAASLSPLNEGDE